MLTAKATINDKIKTSDYIKVKINKATSGTLFGDYITTIQPEKEGIALTA